MPPREDSRFFGRNASILLDVLRFVAALAVALTHMQRHFVARAGFISERSGNSAVCVFFVLSGFVIRYITVARVSTGREYWIDRTSRIYSVVAPALLLTVLFEAAALLLAPSAYHGIADVFPWSQVPLQLVENLTFTVGWWGFGAPPLSNGPFWSLSFECVYYALYGFLLYLPRGRWLLVPLLLLLSGPSIALLFPIWLFGVVLHDVYVRLHARRNGLVLSLGALAGYLGILYLCRAPLLGWLRATEVAERTTALTHAVASVPWGRALFHGATLHWLDRFSLSFFLTGSLLAVAMLPALLALDQLFPAASRPFAYNVRVVADSTFTLYLLHLPLFILFVSLAGGPWSNWRAGLSMLAVVVTLSILFGRLFDRFKDTLRSRLREMFPPSAAPAAGASIRPRSRFDT